MSNLGKMASRTVEKIREAIFFEMMNEDKLLHTEVLYYELMKLGITSDIASQMALKIHGGGKKVNSAYLKDSLMYNKTNPYLPRMGIEQNQRQITYFIKQHMNSTRIDELDEKPTTWQMNGFKTQERPYIIGLDINTLIQLRDEYQKKLNGLLLQSFSNPELVKKYKIYQTRASLNKIKKEINKKTILVKS